MTLNRGVHRHAHVSPRLLAGLAVGALAALVGASAAVAAPIAVDPEPSPSPSATPEPTGTVDDVSAVLDTYGPFVVAGGQSLSANVTLTNDAVDPVPEVAVRLSITDSPIESREALADFFDDPSVAPMRVMKSVAAGTPEVDEDDEPLNTGTLRPSSPTQVRVAASSKDLALPDGTAGVYGVTASFTVGSSTVFINSMAVTWLDADIATLPVTAIATIAGAPSRAASLLAGADVEGVTFAVDPTSLSAAGPRDVLTGRETYLLPATNPDVASLAHAGDTDLIEFALDDARSRIWTPIAERPWLALSAVADQSVASWTNANGAVATLFDDEHATKSPTLDEVDGWVPAVVGVETADDETAPIIVPDAGLSTLVANFRPADPAGPSRIVAESALLAFDGDGTKGVVVSPGLDWNVAGDAPSANLSALMSAPWVTHRSLTEALADPRQGEETIPRVQGAQEDVPVDNITALSARLAGLERLAETLNNPNAILQPDGRTLLGAVSSASRGNEQQQATAYEVAITDVGTTLDSVGIVRSSDINLIATSGEVPITIHNDLAFDSTVTVVMRSTSPNLQVRDRPVITVPAGEEATAMVPVEAVSSANVSLSVWLVNADGDPVSEAQDFTMRVRADWGNAATAVFTGLLVLVLIGGVIRTIRRGRKDTRTGPGKPAEGAKIVDEEEIDD
ncbi:DUF6049 family protein [Demequina aurantiaca]|uniref:DUF6049 family protein n=1 Tax=Demequina aurantiaca TaxID=676200 RepID=UPI000A3E7184|nr:DUF6049 family protein [Demequina aurantiaca]